jgi:hypothetical protein
VILAAAATALSGCSSRTTTLNQVNVFNPQTRPAITAGPAGSHISFVGDDPVKSRQVQDFSDRTFELVKLKNNGAIGYIKRKGSTFPATYTDASALRVDLAKPFYRQNNITYDEKKIKKSGPHTYIVLSSESHNCFLFHTTFGAGEPRGDQQLAGGMCYTVTFKDADTLEREMLDIIGRVRIDGHPVGS